MTHLMWCLVPMEIKQDSSCIWLRHIAPLCNANHTCTEGSWDVSYVPYENVSSRLLVFQHHASVLEINKQSWINCCFSAKPLTNESIDRRECFVLFGQAKPNVWHAWWWCQRQIPKCSVVVVLLAVGLTAARMRCSVTVSYVVFGNVQHAFKM